MYHKRGLWAIKAKNGGTFPEHEKKAVAAAPAEKPPKFYLADDVKKPLVNKRKAIPTKLRCPFKINGVPLRRVNQSYVIATSTKVDISGVNVEKFDDKYFGKKVENKKKKKGEGEFFEAEKEEKNTLPHEKKDDQKSVDTALIQSIEAVPDLKSYLGARFSLKAGMKPHELVF
ncbi:putative 60S ribosomal protein L6E [Helianthus annuus]|nr:putative 60S ribosomal protein L6E [Helianthus annuus]KAJ0448590.1 putative 60S ribosomal protein L6E [Helianthus annuus]KAJ0633469.1 putative 60S ribosomal protein L6E [Helianthus annuus]KAJ0637282.1 putative 60S ribosomal protein L6E [Helianthus annuus]KAJ0814410.1 putative 60S ribosomal protein L6E [Helianthus annuus]